MRNILKIKAILVIAGFIALAVIIGFSFAACGGDDDNGGNSGSPFDGTWVNDADATDTITINNPNWTRTKGSDKSGILHYDSAPSPDTPNIRDTSGSNIGEAKIVGGKLHWDIGWSGAVIFSKGTSGGNNGGNNGGNGGTSWSFKIINQSNEDCAQVRIFPGTAASSGYAASLWQLNVTAAAGTTSQVYSSTANIGTSVKFAGRNNDSMYTIRSNALTLTAGNTYVLTITNWDDYDSNSLSVTVE